MHSAKLSSRLRNSFNITLVGAGNAAWHIGHRLIDTGNRIITIINRSNERSEALANDLHCSVQTDFSISNAGSDFVIVAVNDTVLRDVLSELDSRDTIIVHTSGSLGMDVFPKKTERYGVLYPFQTLTAGVAVDFSQIPVCIEGSEAQTSAEIARLAASLSGFVRNIDTQQRRILHLAGVIGNNFTNYFMTRAIDLLEKNNVDKSILMPLLEETMIKLKKTGPYDAQTGPARRKNREVIAMHLELLNREPELKKLYGIVSDSIIAYYTG
jgi:predicted short-subunit dehydrogenase-like oxidoreductase (DUF2520 family)